MDKQEAKLLLQKFRDGEATEAEMALLDAWYLSYRKDEPFGLSDEEFEIAELLMYSRLPGVEQGAGLLPDEVQPVVVRPKKIRLWPRIAVAAAVAAVVVGVWFYSGNNTVNINIGDAKASAEIKPGKNIATLIAYGRAIPLSDTRTGVVIGNDGVTYDDGSAVSSSNAGKDREAEVVSPMAAITPRGGQYQFTLPDGTKVWLNADSKISFPSKFSGRERKILLSGEGYFEVAKDKAHPFIVVTDRGGGRASQEVEVLGTHFNINSYEDEPQIRTTLLEGSVRVASLSSKRGESVILKPNQQAVNAGNSIRVNPVDPADAIAWKEGSFSFTNESLGSIMRKVARWYNVEVIYEDDVQGKTFSGAVSRFDQVSTLLKMLETTGRIRFEINGKKITVRKK